jgi:hypothetical protein
MPKIQRSAETDLADLLACNKEKEVARERNDKAISLKDKIIDDRIDKMLQSKQKSNAARKSVKATAAKKMPKNPPPGSAQERVSEQQDSDNGNVVKTSRPRRTPRVSYEESEAEFEG